MPLFYDELKANDITCSLEKTLPNLPGFGMDTAFGPWLHGCFNTNLLPEVASHPALTFPKQLIPYWLLHSFMIAAAELIQE